MAATKQGYTFEDIDQMAKFILARTGQRPQIGVVCGSGLGGLADLLTDSDVFPYGEIPGFPTSEGKNSIDKIL
jgi:purine-nucleoside phosphorylase